MNMKREIKKLVQGYPTIDGDGVHLVRVLGNQTMYDFDPILMLDSFDTDDYEAYKKGFPMHPHRGIETISYLSQGKMLHRDSLGNEEIIQDGEVQWMNSGSGIMHEERLPQSRRLLGVQLWLNLPRNEKMSKPTYTSITNDMIREIDIPGGKLRLLAGTYQSYTGFTGQHLPFNYYSLQFDESTSFQLTMDNDDSVMVFTLKNSIHINDTFIPEKTAVKFTQGDFIQLDIDEKNTEVLYIASKALHEDIAWAGPIVMNKQEEINQAFLELNQGLFVKEGVNYD